MQVFNLEISKKVKAHKMAESEAIQYWTWINNTTLGVVTTASVYHWSIEGEPGNCAARALLGLPAQLVGFRPAPLPLPPCKPRD